MKKEFLITILILVLVLSPTIVSAEKVTARLGESRKVLDAQTGESIERFLFVENVNTVPLTISFEPAGDLAEYLKLEETEITLQPGDEQKVYYTITAYEPGQTETNINVKFVSPDGSGAGLTATIILIAEGESVEPPSDNSLINFFNTQGSEPTDDNENKNYTIYFLAISPVVLIAILLALVFYTKRKKEARRPRA